MAAVCLDLVPRRAVDEGGAVALPVDFATSLSTVPRPDASAWQDNFKFGRSAVFAATWNPVLNFSERSMSLRTWGGAVAVSATRALASRPSGRPTFCIPA